MYGISLLSTESAKRKLVTVFVVLALQMGAAFGVARGGDAWLHHLRVPPAQSNTKARVHCLSSEAGFSIAREQKKSNCAAN